MKKNYRTLLLILLVVIFFIQPAFTTIAEAKSHHHQHHSNHKIAVMECTRSGTRVKFPRSHLTIKDSWTYISDNRHGFLCMSGEYSSDYEVDKNRLFLEFYPGSGIGNGYPGREYIQKKHAYRIGHSNIYVYGWIVRGKTKNYYRHHKHIIGSMSSF